MRRSLTRSPSSVSTATDVVYALVSIPKTSGSGDADSDRHCSSFKRRRTISPKIPLTNRPDSSSPYFFASSTASLTATLSGMSGR